MLTKPKQGQTIPHGSQIPTLAAKASSLSKNNGGKMVNHILTARDVAVDGFCTNRCRTSSTGVGDKARFAYTWVGNSMTQCPGHFAWPFHQTIYSPKTHPLVAPNGDVGVDRMIINPATALAGTVTNPFNNGYFQGSADAPLEEEAYPGYPRAELVDKNTEASYIANGINRRKYLLPAMWNPRTSALV